MYIGEKRLVPATGYEAAVEIWIDTWEADEENGRIKFNFDKNTGRLIMLLYEEIL